MAVYKATYCYPFLTSVDARVATIIGTSGAKPASYLKCKIDTSNKNITGYRIRLIDSDNNQIFPIEGQEGKISPISELGQDSNGNNTGVNGTFLNIPFFQNYHTDHRLKTSYNNIYYKGDYLVDYLISDIPDGTKEDMDDVSNWSYNSTYYVLTYNNWSSISSGSETISINGDCPIGGQLVLFKDVEDSTYNGIYKITTRTIDDEEQIVLELVEPDYGTTVITKGNYHNKIVTSDSSSYYTGPIWQCCDNSGNLIDIPNLYINTNIKWEITLYQGAGDETLADPLEITYDNLSNEEYDMVMTSGKILGSTPERIQISNIDDIEDTMLPSANDEVLVLQTRWIQLESSPTPNNNNQGIRAYVQTYDSIYGHVYPSTDSLSSYAVDSASTCKFYKHSNNQEDILDTDIVKVGINNVDVDIRHYTESGNNFLYIANFSDLTGYSLTDGDSVLLTGQSENQENGVYTYYESPGDINEHRLRRHYSYSNWASYIGKVIYCIGGDWAGQNVESLAQSGTYTLWNPLQNVEDGNSLIFKQEQPILLFRKGINYTVDYYYGSSVSGTTITTTALDSEKVSNSMIGQKILSYDRKIFTITNVVYSDNTYTLTLELKETIASEDFRVLFNHGKICGGNVYHITDSEYISITSSTTPDYNLYTAKILKNTTTKTYISPYINISKNMKLKVYSGEVPQWVTITGFNKTTWCITHSALSEPFLSYSLNDSNIPYKYDIRSFFKTSDENPIYVYETPYIKLYKEGKDFTDLSSLNKSIEQLLVESSGDDYDDYYVKENEEQVEDANAIFYVQAYQDRTVIDKRYVDLEGKFVSFGNSSWESYRWYLYDGNGKKVQDTGKKYDKNIKVSFYGLSNDLQEDVVYYAVLVVEDSLKTELKYIIRMKIGYDKESISSAVNKEFNATFDCQSYSVELNYENFGSIYPAIKMANRETQAFIEENINNLSLDWKNTKLYYNNGWMNIGEPNRIIYQELNNNIIPISVRGGVSYFTTFGKGKYTLEEADLATNHLSLNNGQNEIYTQIGVEITENFCGDIVNFVIDAVDNDAYGPYVDEDYEIVYTSNSLQFRIYTEDNFNSDNINSGIVNTLNSERNKIKLKINKITDNNSGTISETKEQTIIDEFFEKDILPKYYLQTVSNGDSTEYLHYYLYKNNTDSEVILTNNNSEKHVELYMYNNATAKINRDPGCLNLTTMTNITNRANNNIASYWVENKKIYYLLDSVGIFENFDTSGNPITNNNLCFVESNIQEDDELYWPNEEDEENYYWNDEGYSSSDNDPIYYENVNASTTGYTTVIAKDRHLTSKKYNIVFSISNISHIYNNLSNCEIVQDDTDSSKFNIINGTDSYGYIQIKIME